MTLSWLHQYFESLESNPFRDASWKRFQNLGLPDRSREVFRYLSLKELYNTVYSRSYDHVQPVLDRLFMDSDPVLFFLNGSFCSKLSKTQGLPKEVTILPTSQAQQIYSAYFQQKWGRLAREEKDPFAVLNGACFNEGVFLYIPSNFHCLNPFRIVHIVNAEHRFIVPRIDVFCGKMSKIDFIYQVQSTGNNWINGAVDLSLEEGSKATFTSVIEGDGQGWHFEAFRSLLKSHASLHHLSFTNGNRIMRQDFSVVLNGEGSNVNLTGAWRCNEKLETHINALIDHQKPHTTSSQLFKGILDGASRSSFEGKILVRSEAQKTQAYQINRNLLLSKHAAAFSKPNLEIAADDVKASHGSTVGPLDDELLFYLKSRGIASSHLLIQGFLQEIYNQIMHPLVNKSVKQLFQL